MLSEFPMNFLLVHRGKLLFTEQPLINLLLIGDIWDIPQEGVINLDASAATAFYKWNQVRINLQGSKIDKKCNY